MTENQASIGAAGSAIAERIAALDPSLMGIVETQTTPTDRQSLLALHAACHTAYGQFTYLEVGSHLGGSLQALVADPACTGIVSIDSRPPSQPDNRGIDFEYVDNSSARMLGELSRVPGADLSKITILETETSNLTRVDVPVAPELCLVDGEHTDQAMLQDAEFCLSVMGVDGCLAFHDSNLLPFAIENLIGRLRGVGRPFTPYFLPDCVFVIELGEPKLLPCEPVQRMLARNHEGFLWGLKQAMAWAR